MKSSSTRLKQTTRKNGLTVVIASYRYGHLAAQAIESVLDQTRQPEYIWFIDDGAQDCFSLPDIYKNSRIGFILRRQTLGVVNNFQNVLSRIPTEKVMMLGADNWLHPKCLELTMEKAEDFDIVSYDLRIVGGCKEDFVQHVGAVEDDGYYRWNFEKGDINEKNYIHGSALYDVRKARIAGGYKDSGGPRTEEDWMLWKAMLANGCTHAHIEKPLMYYRKHLYNFNGN